MAALSGARNRTELEALSRPNRTAMAWASARTARDGRFLVVTERRSGADPVSEWFPALTGRVSVATPSRYAAVYDADGVAIFARR